MTWTTELHYIIFWQVNNPFQSPFIISPIVCIYELKYRMRWSDTIYNIIVYKERALHEINKFKKGEPA